MRKRERTSERIREKKRDKRENGLKKNKDLPYFYFVLVTVLWLFQEKMGISQN